MSLSPDVTDLRLILDSTAWTPRCVSGTWIPQEKISRIPECGSISWDEMLCLTKQVEGLISRQFQLQFQLPSGFKGPQWLIGFANGEQRRKNRTKKNHAIRRDSMHEPRERVKTVNYLYPLPCNQ